jgi:large-conductance mechanosensitive channel
MLIELAQSTVDKTSGAYGAGKIVGYIVIALVVFLIVRALINRNK